MNTEPLIITEETINTFLDAVVSILASALFTAAIFAVVFFLAIFIVSLVFDRDGR